MPVESAILGKNAPAMGLAPAVILINPKNGHNVARAVRSASVFDFKQVWWTGNRVTLEAQETKKGKKRLPREERMKGYQEVDMIHCDRPFDQFKNATPVAIEVRKDSEILLDFEHPEHPVYVFGPEDGSIPPEMLQHCHRFVVIPGKHCLNLANAVSTVMYDREIKRYWNGEIEKVITPGDWEQRGVCEMPEFGGGK